MTINWSKSLIFDEGIEGEYLINDRVIKITYFNGDGVHEKIQEKIEKVVIGCLQSENKIIAEIGSFYVNLYNEYWTNEFIEEEYKSLSIDKFISLVTIDSFDYYGLDETLNIYFRIEDEVYFGRNFINAVVNDNLEISNCSI